MIEQVPGYGPRLCVLPEDGVGHTVPWPCQGLAVLGWDWGAVRGEERFPGGVISGTYRVVGTYEAGSFADADPATSIAGQELPDAGDAAGRFTLTSPVGPPLDHASDPGIPNPDLRSPCPVPAGGWGVVDPAKASGEAQTAAREYATAQPDYGGGWIDHSPDPTFVPGQAEDTSKTVLNATFTGDLPRHEREMRVRWGGPLCVSEATRTYADLQATVQKVINEVGVLWSAPNEVAGHVEIGVMADGGSLQQRLDREYGPGTVVVRSVLHPLR
jgi:hypothetical protein